jgi:hypothetical protein
MVLMAYLVVWVKIEYLVIFPQNGFLFAFLVFTSNLSTISFSCSRVKESDGSYFETFTALSWQRENWRMEAIQAAEARAEIQPVTEREIDPDDDMERPEDKEELYIDVLYTIANTVGAQVGQVSEFNRSASFN